MLAFLEESGVSPALLQELERFRKAYPAGAELQSRVPVPRFHYYGREVWECALAALLCGKNLLLTGGKATGKNVLAENLAAAFGRPSWNVSFHVSMDAAALVGTDTFTGGQVVFRPGPVYQCARYGGIGILDEINMAKNEALAVLHSALDFRQVLDVPGYERLPMAEPTRFVATMNYGYAGTRELNEALASRFVVLQMPTISPENLDRLLQRHCPALRKKYRQQLGQMFFELQKKCESSEISTKALDLRGLLDALELARAGVPIGSALDMGITCKSFDAYEQGLIRDVMFVSFCPDGSPNLYLNTIVGCVRKWYGEEGPEQLFHAWAGDRRRPLLDDLAWLALESAAFHKELAERPLLEGLRQTWAEMFFDQEHSLSRQEWMAKNQLSYTMQAARWRAVLGRRPPVMLPHEKRLSDALDCGALEGGELFQTILNTFSRFRLFTGKSRPPAALRFRLTGNLAGMMTRLMPNEIVHTDVLSVEHGAGTEEGKAPKLASRRAQIRLNERAGADRLYIESCFGPSLLPPQELRTAELALCTGVHLGCHLWITAGVPNPKQAKNPEARRLAE